MGFADSSLIIFLKFAESLSLTVLKQWENLLSNNNESSLQKDRVNLLLKGFARLANCLNVNYHLRNK
jgi:hypothetical protein